MAGLVTTKTDLIKRCARCEEVKHITSFGTDRSRPDGRHPYCRPCRNDIGREVYERNPRSERCRVLRRKYGLTAERFDEMLAAQGGGCAVCSTTEPGGRWGLFHVDHDHETGEVRALLCHRCNVGLGYFGDDPELLRLAADYLGGAR